MRQFPRLFGRAAALSALLALAACSRSGPAQNAVPDPAPAATDPYAGGQSFPWTDRLGPSGADPYAGNQSWPWTGPRSPAALGAAAQDGENVLSDLSWTSATNAWGPVERNQSNGDRFATDGRSLTIGGQVYAKGLGVHANSEISYALGAMCNLFTAQVGVDD
ncbi:NPCBM/NEW2 domain-containing protein, partial [Deinococcus petrolearius]